MSSVRLFLSEMALVMGIVGLSLSILWAVLRPRMRWFAFAPGSWFAHVIVFYAYVVFLRPVVSEFNAVWSLALRYHALFLVTGAILVFIAWDGNRNHAT